MHSDIDAAIPHQESPDQKEVDPFPQLAYEQLPKKHGHRKSVGCVGRKIAEFYFLEKEQKELEMGLLDTDKRYLLMRERFPGIEAILPQYYIASYLGISPTQLSRIRKKLSQT